MGIKLVNSKTNINLTQEGANLKLIQQQMLKGDPGDSAYDIALEHGFEGTEEEWLASLKGEDGAPGEAFEYEDFTAEQLEALKGKDGEPGKDGYTPIKGVDYFDGEPGAKGEPFTYDDFTEEQLAALKGADGESGVYVGETEPTDDSLIWINPTEDSTAFATEEYVDNAIANIDLPESGGGGTESYYLPWWPSGLTDEDKAFLAEYVAYYNTNGKPKPVEIYFYNGNNYWPATAIIGIGSSMVAFYTSQSPEEFNAINYSFSNGVYSGGWNYEVGGDTAGGGNDWNYTTDNYDSNLYNAHEIYLMVYDSNADMYLTSHVLFPNGYYLYEYTDKCFVFTTAEGLDYNTPFWRYDGSSININRIDNYELITIAYKL